MNWRTLGDTTLDAFRAALPTNSEIVKRGEVEAVYYSAQPHTRLVLGMLKAESSYATHFNAVPPSKRNPLNLRKRGQAEFDTFSSIAACVTEWNDRITSPTYAYKDTVTVRDLVNIYAPSFENDVNKYVATVEAVVNALPVVREEVAPVSESLVLGRVPKPPMIINHASKSGPGNGYSHVPGGRNIVGACDHITDGYGSLQWYRDFFSIGGERHSDALVDYVIDREGRCIEINDPFGTRSPWANGKANHLEGDGPAFVAKFGVGAVNDRLVSIEHVGKSPQPMTAPQLEMSAQLKAWLFDRIGVKYSDFPVNQKYGVTTHMQHWEFSDKPCPGAGMRAQTNELQDRVRAIMKQFQVVDGAPDPAPEPEPEKPKHEIPEGETLESLRRYYGKALNPVTGEMEGFDLRFAPSQVWMAEGKKTGRWPKVREIVLRGNGDLRYSWEGGFHWTRKAKKED